MKVLLVNGSSHVNGTTMVAFAEESNNWHIILDTPSVAKVSHKFYERAGFRKISKEELPIRYTYPNRDSLLYQLNL